MDLHSIIENKKTDIDILIRKYKENIQKGGLADEEYKWLLFEKQKGLPSIDKNTIVDEVVSLEFGNLLYHNAVAVMKHLKRDRKEKYADALVYFYDEDRKLQDRIDSFDKEIMSIYRELIPNLAHHHDERTMSLLLSFKYPDKYILYKNSFYTKLCKLLGIKTETKNQKYVHYLQIAEIIRDKFIKNDQELITLIQRNLSCEIYYDAYLNILTQDFLYVMLEKDTGKYDLFLEIKEAFKEELAKRTNCSIAIGNDSNKDFQRVQDKYDIIGKDFVHYELYCDESNVYIDLHLENAKQPKEITVLLKSLYLYLLDKKYNDQTIVWFDWANKASNKNYFQSVRYCKIFSLDDEDILSDERISEMIKSFVELDSIIGDDIREFLVDNYAIERKIVQEYITEENMKHPINQILYGPPGTGKTYNTINKAIAIANPAFDLNQDRMLIKAEYQRLVDLGQIVFTTFHQSMTYEDFIEGIKPVIEENEDGVKSVVYEVKDGIFKEACKNAGEYLADKNDIVKNYTFDDAFNDLISAVNEKNDNKQMYFLPILTENKGLNVVGISDRGNLILKPRYSDDAKEYIVSYSRTKKLYEVFSDLSLVKNIDKEFRAVIGGSNTTAYWAVLNYINEKIKLERKQNPEEMPLPKSHVLIIDEINRGNVSQIFGELITLIEEDKRLGNDEAIQITLPYSKEKFGVPSNLYIIGTMNTADRSVEALDMALRRRFVFEEMPPKYDLNELKQEVYGFSISEILKKINNRIEKLLDRDHQIGHAYFINKDEKTIIDSFYKNIIPLLQEYFFGDYSKIGLVLGAGFVRVIKNDSVFADFDHLDYSLFDERESFEIIDHKENDQAFGDAIKLLMN